MDNRTRKNQLKIYLTDEEKEIFEKKMKLANCKTMSHPPLPSMSFLCGLR